MQLLKVLLYNTSVFGLFNLLQNKYQDPVVLHDDYRHQTKLFDTPMNLVLSHLNIPWTSLSIDYRNHDILFKKKNFLHILSVEKFSNTKDRILDIILRNSNTFRIQNLILINEHPAHSAEIDEFFNYNERLHRNTLICEQEKENIACWHWISEMKRMNQTLSDVLNAPINLDLINIRINVTKIPPNSLTPCFCKKYIFSGLDAMVTAETLSRFNATSKYCNQFLSISRRFFCNRREKINCDDAVTALQQMKRNKASDIYINTVFDSRMIKYLFFEDAKWDGVPHLHMNAIHKLGDNMNALYPTEFVCILLLIPKANTAPSFWSFIKRTNPNSIEFVCFICIVIAFSIGRIIISNSALRECRQCFDIFYSTIGGSLGQIDLKPKKASDRILIGFILLTSILTTVMMSGLIYTNLVNNPSSKNIQTLDDLAASNYQILVPSYLKEAENWIHLRKDIRDKLVFVSRPHLMMQFLTSNASAAVAIDEYLLDLFKRTDDMSKLDYNMKNIYYEMEENLCKLID